MSANQQVITIDDISEANAPAIYVAGGLDKFFVVVEKEVTGEVPDLTTKKGRDRIASLAAKVSSSKAAVEKPGRDYLRKLKEMPKVIEVELAAWVKKMDALRDSTRKPLSDWEAADKARIAGHKETLAWLDGFLNLQVDLDVATLESHMSEVEAFEISQALEEFEADSARGKDAALATLRGAIKARTKHEAELADIARFNAEKAEREQQERDAAIAREAVEKAQREADQRAQAERDAAAKREQDLIDQAAEAKRTSEQAARDAATTAENQRLQLQLQAEQAENSRLAAEQRAEQERKDSAVRAERAAEEARQAEVDRQKAAADEVIRQQDLREADKEHKKTICLAAQKALIAGGINEEVAKAVIILIHQRKVPAVSIAY